MVNLALRLKGIRLPPKQPVWYARLQAVQGTSWSHLLLRLLRGFTLSSPTPHTGHVMSTTTTTLLLLLLLPLMLLLLLLLYTNPLLVPLLPLPRPLLLLLLLLVGGGGRGMPSTSTGLSEVRSGVADAPDAANDKPLICDEDDGDDVLLMPAIVPQPLA
jgi:hypothetical protein